MRVKNKILLHKPSIFYTVSSSPTMRFMYNTFLSPIQTDLHLHLNSVSSYGRETQVPYFTLLRLVLSLGTSKLILIAVK